MRLRSSSANADGLRKDATRARTEAALRYPLTCPGLALLMHFQLTNQGRKTVVSCLLSNPIGSVSHFGPTLAYRPTCLRGAAGKAWGAGVFG